MKRFIIVLIFLLTGICYAADTAKQIDFLLSGYRDPVTDNVLSGGKVYTYLDGTSTLSALWTDKDKGVTAANPVILDSGGKAEVYGDNTYKFVIYDEDDVIVETLTGLEYKSVSASTATANLSTYGCDFATAVSSIGSTTDTHLIVDCDPSDLGSSLVVTDNITIEWRRGYTLGGAYTLTIQGSIIAGQYQIFESNITVTGNGVKANIPQWWGAVADGSTDDYTAIAAAITAAGQGGMVTFPTGTYVVTDTPTMIESQTWRGEVTGFDAASSDLDLAGSWIKQTGSGKNGIFIGIAGAAGANGEIDGWTVENLIVSTNTDGNHGIVINNALRGAIRNIVVPGCKEDGIHMANYCFLNTFDNVKVISGASTGLGQVKNGFVGDSGPNDYMKCGASGITTGTGYGWHLNGESSSVFTNCESEGNKYGVYFDGAAAYNTFIGGMVMEANTTADVGGSSTNPKNIVLGLYNSTNNMLLNENQGSNIYPGTPSVTGETGVIISRMYGGELTTRGFGKVHVAGTGTDIATADSAGLVPLVVESLTNTADSTVLALMNRAATPTGYAKFGFDDGVLTLQNRNINTGGVKAFSINPQGGELICLPTYSHNMVGETKRAVYVNDSGEFGYDGSTRKFKTNITPMEDTSWIYNLEPVNYEAKKMEVYTETVKKQKYDKDLKIFKEEDVEIKKERYLEEGTGIKRHGLIAEDVEKVNPAIVFYDKVDGKDVPAGVHYDHLIPILLNEIQKLKAEVDALK
jgi:hypothetical protein